MDITANIKRIRESKGYAQSKLADLLQMERANYHRLENRGTKMTIEQLQSIADALEVPIGELLGVKETPASIERGGRVLELEDRIKDKDFKLKAFESETYTLKILIFESLKQGMFGKTKLSDYMDFIDKNPWLLTLLSGLALNKIQIKEQSWNKYWHKALTKYIYKVEDEVTAAEDPYSVDRDVILGQVGFSLLGSDPKDLDKFLEWSNDPKNEYQWITFYMFMDMKQEGHTPN